MIYFKHLSYRNIYFYITLNLKQSLQFIQYLIIFIKVVHQRLLTDEDKESDL